MKKIIRLVLGMLLSLNVIADEWYDESTGFTWYYTISGDSATLTGCSPKEGKLPPLPSILSGKIVKTIKSSAFSGCSGFTGSLTIPDSVTTLGERAFLGCSGFTGHLTIGDNVTSIGALVFNGCSGFTGTLIIPDSVTSIGNGAFNGCSGFTGSLIIGDSVTSIGNEAFDGCSGFTGSLSIPNSVVSIGNDAFYRCSGFTGSLTIPDNVTAVGSCAFLGCSGFTGSLTIGNSVVSIGNSAFSACSGFTGSLTIGNSVVAIGNNAFYGCNGFTGSLTIPDSVMSIGSAAFTRCSGFTGLLTIGETVTSIGQDAFSGCSGFTGSLTIPDSVTTIGAGAFSKCIGFTGSLTIPNSITVIKSGTFSGCRGFSGSLIIPNSVTSVEGYAFNECIGFTGPLMIPNSVTFIGSCAFSYCRGFTGSLTIPDSVTSIGEYAFNGCSGLGDLVFMKGVPPQGFTDSSLWGKKISYLPEYGEVWQKFLSENVAIILNGGLTVIMGNIYDAGYIQSNVQTISIVSSKIRDTDPTVMDVVYKVTSSQRTVKVRALAFKDGVRSFANVVRPETFIEGTDVNIGDGIAANVEHKLSWKVSADWQETLAKVTFEVLSLEGELLPLELTTLPKTDSQPKMEVSWNQFPQFTLFDALMWLYADKDIGLRLEDGVLKNGDVRLAAGASVDKTMYDATVYVYGKMGYELLQGERLEYARQMLRRNLPSVSVAQYAVKVIEE